MRRSKSGGRRRCTPGGRASRRRPAISARSTQSAIERVRDEARPDPRDADELHDALLTAGFSHRQRTRRAGSRRLSRPRCVETRRAAGSRSGLARRRSRLGRRPSGCRRCSAVHPTRRSTPAVAPPAVARRARLDARDAIVELLRGRLTIAGPDHGRARSPRRCRSADGGERRTRRARIRRRGPARVVHRRRAPAQWCDRRLLARIHRYTLNRLRAEIEPVSPADFMRFLFAWQHVEPSSRLSGIDGLRAIDRDAGRLRAGRRGWERAVLPARIDRYEPSMLDTLCLTGEVGWARLSSRRRQAAAADALVGTTPVALFLREHCRCLADAARIGDDRDRATRRQPEQDRATQGCPTPLSARGASGSGGAAGPRRVVSPRLAAACALDERRCAPRSASWSRAGLVTSDGFAGLRAIVRASAAPPPPVATAAATLGRAAGRCCDRDDPRRAARGGGRGPGLGAAAALRRGVPPAARARSEAAPWRELTRVYRRLEARGEIRGGRFVAGMSGEQFALPEAVERLREVRRTPADGRLVTISAADPAEPRPASSPPANACEPRGQPLVYRDGVPLAALEGDYVRPLTPIAARSPPIWPSLSPAAACRRCSAVTSERD